MNQTEEKLLSPSEVIQIKYPPTPSDLSFDTRRLKAEEFTRLGNGRFVFRQSDLEKSNGHYSRWPANESNRY